MTGIRWTLEDVTDYQRRRTRKHESPALEPAPQRREPSVLERKYDQQLEEAGLPAPRRDWFFLNDRNFELDRAWPALKVAVEIQGMAHRIKGRFKADIEKKALALLAGWTILEVDGASIRDGRAIAWTKRMLEMKA